MINVSFFKPLVSIVRAGQIPTGNFTDSPSPFGFTQYEPELGWTLLQGRYPVAQLLATGLADWSWLHRVGGVFTFDQERTGSGKTISRQVWNIIHGTAEAARENEELRTTDPRTILIDLALQSLVPSIASKGQVADEFRQIQKRYAHICDPRRWLGPSEMSWGSSIFTSAMVRTSTLMRV